MKRAIFAIIAFGICKGTVTYADNRIMLPEANNSLPDNYYEALAQINPDGFENEVIDYYSQNPIQLKYTNAGYLSQVPSIDYLTAIRIIDLVQLAGFDDYGQIADSLRLSDYQSDLLRICTVLGEDTPTKPTSINLRTRCLAPLNESRGANEGAYNGDNYNFYQRLTAKSNDFRGGITLDKDRGETSYTDYITAFIEYNSSNFSLIVGDYYIESGLGSILWSPYGLRKSAEVSSVFRQWGSGIKPNVYSNENHFLRGICSDFQINMNKSLNLNISAWFSDVDRSGTVDSISGYVTSVKDDGYYQTKSDESKRNTFNELNTGACVILNDPSYVIGISGYYIKFDRYIETGASSTMIGRDGIFTSFFGNLNFGSQKLIFELSRDNRGYFAIKSGLLFTNSTIKYGLFYRYFPWEFRSPYGYNFGQASSPSNEGGLYSFLEFKLSKSININTYLDFYRSLSRCYTYPAVKRGFEFLTEINCRINTNNSLKLRLTYDNGYQINDPINENRIYHNSERYALRGELVSNFDKALSSRIRIEGVLMNGINSTYETGISNSWEIDYKPMDYFSLTAGFNYFATDSYNSAIWMYEYNFPGYFYSVALFGSGLRYSLCLNYHPLDFISLWAKYLVTVKNNVETLGSGWDETYSIEQKGLLIQLDINL